MYRFRGTAIIVLMHLCFWWNAVLNDTIKKILIHIDGNVEVDFDGFTQGIDTIGGVEITLTQKEAAHLRSQDSPMLLRGKIKWMGRWHWRMLEFAK